MNKFRQELEEIAILVKILKKREQEIQAHIVFESILLRDVEQFLRFAKEEGISVSESGVQSGYIVSATINGQSFHVMFNKHEREYFRNI